MFRACLTYSQTVVQVRPARSGTLGCLSSRDGILTSESRFTGTSGQSVHLFAESVQA